MVRVALASSDLERMAPITEMDESNTSPVRVVTVDTRPIDGDEAMIVVADDLVVCMTHPDGHDAGRRAVSRLGTVTGHGVQKLLEAAKLLVEQQIDPANAVTCWYREYIKDTSERVGAEPSVGRFKQLPQPPARDRVRPPSKNNACFDNKSRKALLAKSYRRNVSEWPRKRRVVVRITISPMKPQMRLTILRDFLIPKLVHGLTFAVVTGNKLRALSHLRQDEPYLLYR